MKRRLQRVLAYPFILLCALFLSACGGDSESTFPSPSSLSAEQQAMQALDDLDHYLNLAGINEHGDFLTNQMQQLNWLYNSEQAREDTQGMLMVILETVLTTMIVSAASNELVAVLKSEMTQEEYDSLLEANNDCLPLSFLPFPFFEIALYCPEKDQVHMLGFDHWQQSVDILIDITDIRDGLEADPAELSYTLQPSSISNATAEGELEGELVITVHSDAAPLIDILDTILAVIGGGSPDVDLLALLEELSDLHVRASVIGEGALAKAGEPTYAFTGYLDAWGALNLGAIDFAALLAGEGDDIFNGNGTFLELAIIQGELVSPEGDTLYGPSPHRTNRDALYIAIDDNSELETSFSFEAFNMPEMHVEASGSLSGLGGLIGNLVGLVSQLFDDGSGMPELDMEDLLAGMAIGGTAQLDIPSDDVVYRFSLDNDQVVVADRSDNPILTLQVTGLDGGVILAGGEPLATFTFLLTEEVLGFRIDFVDTELDARIYSFGAIGDVIDQDLIMLISGLFGGLSMPTTSCDSLTEC